MGRIFQIGQQRDFDPDVLCALAAIESPELLEGYSESELHVTMRTQYNYVEGFPEEIDADASLKQKRRMSAALILSADHKIFLLKIDSVGHYSLKALVQDANRPTDHELLQFHPIENLTVFARTSTSTFNFIQRHYDRIQQQQKIGPRIARTAKQYWDSIKNLLSGR